SCGTDTVGAIPRDRIRLRSSQIVHYPPATLINPRVAQHPLEPVCRRTDTAAHGLLHPTPWSSSRPTPDRRRICGGQMPYGGAGLVPVVVKNATYVAKKATDDRSRRTPLPSRIGAKS